MSKPSLDAIASAKAKLTEELRQLEEQEAHLLQQQASEALAEISSLVSQYRHTFSSKQRAELISLLGADPKPKNGAPTKQVAPKYWLPHSGETWTGRGKTPRAFAAWEGTAAYNEWKKNHPSEKFPAYPG